MAKESKCQAKLINDLEKLGGHVINGIYTKAGEGDLQCGYPININLSIVSYKTFLHYLVIEVKSENDYYRVMKGVEEIDGFYILTDLKHLKDHEILQIHKLNTVRRKGGLAVLAFNIKQVNDYISNKFKS